MDRGLGLSGDDAVKRGWGEWEAERAWRMAKEWSSSCGSWGEDGHDKLEPLESPTFQAPAGALQSSDKPLILLMRKWTPKNGNVVMIDNT